MHYKVKALLNQRLIDLDIEASNEAALRKKLQSQQMELVAYQRRKPFKLYRTSAFSLTLFTQELVALLEAGLTLVEALETLQEKSTQENTLAVLDALIQGLYLGLPFSKILEETPEHFPPLYVATVRSAEKTGHLAEALKRYHYYETRLSAVKKKIVSALIYPAVVLTVGSGIVLFLLFYVIPRFSQIYTSMREVPTVAKIILWWGDWVDAHGGVIFGSLVGALLAIALVLRQAAVRAAFYRWVWRLPKLEGWRRLFDLARLYRTLGLLLAGGIPIVTALETVACLLPLTLQKKLEAAIEDIKTGQPLSRTLAHHTLTTPVSERLLRVGEQSGELATMCERSAQFCDEELERLIELVTRLFEPIVMLVIGIVIGGIVFLLYMPIFEIAGGVQ